MGGDFAPAATIEGAVSALDSIGDGNRIVLLGPEDVIRKELADRGVRTLLQNIHYELPPVHESVPFTLMRRESVRSLGGKETP